MTFSAFMPSITDIVQGTKYVLNGDNNKNYKLFADAYEDSVTNSACINDIVNLIIGEGLVNNTKDSINPNKILSSYDLGLIALDYRIQGIGSYQVIWYENKVVKIKHVPIRNIAFNLDDNMRETGYWYSYDWTQRYKYKPVLYNKFDGTEPENGINIAVIKRPSNEPIFPRPAWYSALKWAQDEGLLAQHSYQDVSTGFSGQKVINWVGGQGLDADAKRELAGKLRDKFTGINGQRLVVSINNSVENAVIVDNIDPPNVNATYVNYTEEAERKILIAHSYPHILLAGSKTGFSSNADEIAVATKSVYRRVIRPEREVILASFTKVFKTIDATCDLDFKDFEEKKIDSNE
jgi:hypothetical protein